MRNTRARVLASLCTAGIFSAGALAAQGDDRAAERAKMVDEISGGSSAARPGAAPPVFDGNSKVAGKRAMDEADRIDNPKVLDAMRRVPRHHFVPADMQREAYINRPLPIGYGQTISQPLIVAMMTELLDPKPGEKVLEIGTGSGYQAAILAEFTPEVYTVEIIEALHKEVLPRLQKVGLSADRVLHADGYFGVEKAAPFDKIIVTAAADHIPPPLIQQLKPGGRMVIPIGPVHATQRLVVVEKDANGKVRSQSVHPVRFVPLTGGPRVGAEKK